MLKDAQNEFSRTMVQEERDYVLGNPHERELADIFRLARVEYGRIDYAIKEGRVQTWEINLHPTIGRDPHPSRNPVPEELKPVRMQSRQHFYRGFQAAWEAVDRPPDGQPPIRLTLDPATIRAAGRDEAPRGLLLGAARRLLRPARPLLKPMVRPFFGMLGRTARSAHARQGG
jgi:hypothetical protein